jgi:hypothetical protein
MSEGRREEGWALEGAGVTPRPRRGAPRGGTALMVLAALWGHALPGRAQDRKLNQIDYAMYFMSEVKDAQECAVSVEDGRILFAPPVTNPAMTCPDMFAWTLFTNVVRDEFWSRWADERQNWPKEPYPLCDDGESPPGCCELGNPRNDPDHCPVFPGGEGPLAIELRSRPRVLRQSVRSELMGAHPGLSGQELMERLAAEPAPPAGEGARPCSALPLPDDPDSIGRVIRQTNGELTIRNQAFHDYVFRNDLYNAEGVVAVFENNASNIPKNAPYRRPSYAAGPERPRADLSTIDFPADAIMIKSNWLNVDLMKAIGTKYGWSWDDAAHPFIEKEMQQTLVEEDTGGKRVTYDCSGTHRLLAFHVSSKDIPNWVWATFEHVQLPGRCDYTGCNDSWGYWSSDPHLPGTARNFIAPKVKSDEFPVGAGSMVYDRDELYAAEVIRPRLTALLDALDIGVAAAGKEPTPRDRAWRSYRLKGSQVEFVDAMGRATYLGHSVTEAGFMNGSSCITCHARAGTSANGPVPPPLGVFVNELSDFGYGKSADGIPSQAWYHQSNQPPSLQVLQTDFVWGFLFASRLVTP